MNTDRDRGSGSESDISFVFLYNAADAVEASTSFCPPGRLLPEPLEPWADCSELAKLLLLSSLPLVVGLVTEEDEEGADRVGIFGVF